MNFTNSPYEKMMKEIPHPGRGGADRWGAVQTVFELTAVPDAAT